jgi:hypothetical protein
MTHYEALLGKRVEAHYRASDLQLSVAGTLVADSGKFIALEEHFVHHGCKKKMRLEIPYQFLCRVVEEMDLPEQASPSAVTTVPIGPSA